MRAAAKSATGRAAALQHPARITTLSRSALYLTPQGRACRFLRMAPAAEGGAAEAEFIYDTAGAGRSAPREGFTLAARNFWLLKQVG